MSIDPGSGDSDSGDVGGGDPAGTGRGDIDPADYIVPTDATAEDIDLDTEEVFLRDGRRLTEDLAEQLAANAVAQARQRNLIPGRKSLGGDGTHSPRIQFRVPATVRDAAEAKAAAEGISLSALAREALEHYVAP